MIRVDGSPLDVLDIATLARRGPLLEFAHDERVRRSNDYAQATQTSGQSTAAEPASVRTETSSSPTKPASRLIYYEATPPQEARNARPTVFERCS
jgi:hypothetical protein